MIRLGRANERQSSKFAADAMKAGLKEGRFEESAARTLERDNVEWAAENCMLWLQNLFNNLYKQTADQQAVFDEMDSLMTEKTIEITELPIFSPKEPKKPLVVQGFYVNQIDDTYTLSFKITDPNKPVKKFNEVVGTDI